MTEINEIIWTHYKIKEKNEIKNVYFNDRYEELTNILKYSIDLWNHIVYAWKKINKQDDNEKGIDKRFYYQSIIFNLYMLSSITKLLGSDITENSEALKDLRNNIAHIDEKLKKPLNVVSIHDVNPDAVEIKEDKKIWRGDIIGLNINMQNNTASSPLGVLGDVVFSSLKPDETRSKYKIFVSYKISLNNLLELQKKFSRLLENYYTEIKFDFLNDS
jgi:hypothetical protein